MSPHRLQSGFPGEFWGSPVGREHQSATAQALPHPRTALRRPCSPAYACAYAWVKAAAPARARVDHNERIHARAARGSVRIPMSPRRHLRYAIAVAAFIATPALAQGPAPTPANPWFMAAAFPEASEEVLSATANNKLYVFAGLAPVWK